jgi:hypothetical protein
MIEYDPKKILKKIAPERKVKKLLTRKVSLKRTALSFVNDLDFLNKKRITEVALKTVKGYRERIAKEVVESDFDREAGRDLEKEIAKDPKQLVQRVQNEVISQVTSEIADKYAGEKYTWLPSDAEEPDPLHQLNYGKVFTVGDGEMPGERPGCRCGMLIHVEGSDLEL